MDSASNGKRNVRPRPSFSNLNFSSQRPNRFRNEMEDNLPPGTIPLPVRFGQFNPYDSRRMFSPPDQPMHSASPNQMFQRTPPIPPTQSIDSRRLMSSTSSLGSAQLTPEHLISTYSQESVGKLKIDPFSEAFDFVASDLQDYGEIGRGAFGAVSRMIHKKSGTEMAVKRIRSTVDEKEQKQLLMDLEVVMRSSDCQYIVKFYGALFWEGDCWICMELMSTSLDKFYRYVYHRQHSQIPEDILGKIAVATVKALDYLKEKLQIMHRDVKPSNILIDRGGNIKLCDFGISGQLVNSIAKTRDAGCRPYMAPERIDTSRSGNGYDVRSDVWSLGITLIELSTGKFPYPKWTNVFDQLTQVVKGDPPKLRNAPPLAFSDPYIEFVNMLTIAEAEQRPKYAKLLATSYLTNMTACPVNVAAYFSTVLNSMTEADFLGDSNSDDAFRV